MKMKIKLQWLAGRKTSMWATEARETDSSPITTCDVIISYYVWRHIRIYLWRNKLCITIYDVIIDNHRDVTTIYDLRCHKTIISDVKYHNFVIITLRICGHDLWRNTKLLFVTSYSVICNAVVIIYDTTRLCVT